MPTMSSEAPIFIPRRFTPERTITIAGRDITDDIIYGICRIPVTENLGDFEITLENSTAAYNYTGDEEIIISLDYTNGTTQQFKGQIEKANAIEDLNAQFPFVFKATGRIQEGELLDILVTKSYTNTEVSAILTNLISTFLTGYTSTNVEVTSPAINTNITFVDKPFWYCVQDLCDIADADCYVDVDKDFRFFKKNSKQITNEFVSSAQNLLIMEGLGDNIIDIKNRVRVYGEDLAGNPVIYQTDDTSSQNEFGVKSITVTDTNIKNETDAQKRAEGEIAISKLKKLKGFVKTLGMINATPGGVIWISVPEQSIHNKYKITEIIHEFGFTIESVWETTLEVETLSKDPNILLRDLVKNIEGKDQPKIFNRENMKFSYNLDFSDSSKHGTFTNTRIVNRSLRLTT